MHLKSKNRVEKYGYQQPPEDALQKRGKPLSKHNIYKSLIKGCAEFCAQKKTVFYG